MLILEFITDESRKIFRNFPVESHSCFIDVYERLTKAAKEKNQFIKLSVLSLLKAQFSRNGFVQFDCVKLLDDFDDFFHENNKRCIQCLNTGYIEDFDELVEEFFYKNNIVF